MVVHRRPALQTANSNPARKSFGWSASGASCSTQPCTFPANLSTSALAQPGNPGRSLRLPGAHAAAALVRRRSNNGTIYSRSAWRAQRQIGGVVVCSCRIRLDCSQSDSTLAGKVPRTQIMQSRPAARSAEGGSASLTARSFRPRPPCGRWRLSQSSVQNALLQPPGCPLAGSSAAIPKPLQFCYTTASGEEPDVG